MNWNETPDNCLHSHKPEHIHTCVLILSTTINGTSFACNKPWFAFIVMTDPWFFYGDYFLIFFTSVLWWIPIEANNSLSTAGSMVVRLISDFLLRREDALNFFLFYVPFRASLILAVLQKPPLLILMIFCLVLLAMHLTLYVLISNPEIQVPPPPSQNVFTKRTLC